jgi:murein DD-endopeptidase MepM/ murein hydrolase activator NlpD
MTHIRQGHWFDLIITEIVLVLLWFNPFAVFYQRSLKLQHEYLADSDVINRNNQVEDYLACMLQRVQVISSGGLVSNFYCKTIKKRINMITKNRSSVRFIAVYALIVPLVCILLYGFTPNKNASGINSTDDEFKPSMYPVIKEKVTKINGYGERINPITKQKDFHYAVDFAIPEGEKVMSTANGVVAEVGFDEKKGNFILIKHGELYASFYSHLKSVSVKTGESVIKGQMIGLAGNTGTYSTGSHLHYEVYKNGERVNPSDYLPK